MAIYHCSVKLIKRSAGRSATAAAAYRAGEKIRDERTGILHNYSRKQGVSASLILAPANTPDPLQERCALWNAVEAVEKRKDAQLAREVEVSLPVELNLEQMQQLISGYAQSQFVDKGMIADINIHDHDSSNPHAHILLTTREVSTDGLGKKNRDWNQKAQLQQWREAWEQQANQALEQAGFEQRINHRSLEDQGIELIPQIHLGAKVREMEQRGIATERGEQARIIEAKNQKIKSLIEELQPIEEALNRIEKVEAFKQEAEKRQAEKAKQPEVIKQRYQEAKEQLEDSIVQVWEEQDNQLQENIDYQEKLLQQHRKKEPQVPTGLLAAFKKSAYQKDHQQWESIRQQLNTNIERLQEEKAQQEIEVEKKLDDVPQLLERQEPELSQRYQAVIREERQAMEKRMEQARKERKHSRNQGRGGLEL